jgi:D-beta-D-heptose 7-phosphate kinase/D-beta-D-heptose 1-phosphate adenosyltransferase
MIYGFTSGVFDLVHIGHVTYLERCRAKCDHLVVLVDSDEMVRARKGPSRPIIGEVDRLRMVQALKPVTSVCPLDSLDELRTHLKLAVRMPNTSVVLFKHDGFKLEEIVGADIPGVSVEIIPDVPGLVSTTEIVNRILYNQPLMHLPQTGAT